MLKTAQVYRELHGNFTLVQVETLWSSDVLLKKGTARPSHGVFPGLMGVSNRKTPLLAPFSPGSPGVFAEPSIQGGTPTPAWEVCLHTWLLELARRTFVCVRSGPRSIVQVNEGVLHHDEVLCIWQDHLRCRMNHLMSNLLGHLLLLLALSLEWLKVPSTCCHAVVCLVLFGFLSLLLAEVHGGVDLSWS